MPRHPRIEAMLEDALLVYAATAAVAPVDVDSAASGNHGTVTGGHRGPRRGGGGLWRGHANSEVSSSSIDISHTRLSIGANSKIIDTGSAHAQRAHSRRCCCCCCCGYLPRPPLAALSRKYSVCCTNNS